MKDLPEVVSILKRASEKAGLVRTRYIEQNTPTSISEVTVLVLFGDLRSTMIASSLLVKRYKEELKGSKYLVLCSWPGYEGLFPYADEFWTVKDDVALKRLAMNSVGFANNADSLLSIVRVLNRHFYETNEHEVLDVYYDNGLKQEFFDRFKNVKRYMPLLPSATSLGPEIGREMVKKSGYKVFLYPAMYANHWWSGKVHKILVPKEFWIELAKKLQANGYCPVIWKGLQTHDISADLTDCIYFAEQDMLKVLTIMRAAGCVLDVFSGISRYAIMARCPYLVCEDRQRYNVQKEYEIDDLCGFNVPRDYVFSFPMIIESTNKLDWHSNLFDSIITHLDKFLPSLDRDSWPTTSEVQDIVPYEKVRKQKAKKLGTKFIKVPLV